MKEEIESTVGVGVAPLSDAQSGRGLSERNFPDDTLGEINFHGRWKRGYVGNLIDVMGEAG